MAHRTTEQAISDIGLRQYGRQEPYVKPPFVSRPLKIVDDRFIVGFGATPLGERVDMSKFSASPYETTMLAYLRNPLIRSTREILQAMKAGSNTPLLHNNPDMLEFEAEVIRETQKRIGPPLPNEEARHAHMLSTSFNAVYQKYKVIIQSQTLIQRNLPEMAELTRYLHLRLASREQDAQIARVGKTIATAHSAELKTLAETNNPPKPSYADLNTITGFLHAGVNEGARLGCALIDSLQVATTRYNCLYQQNISFPDTVATKGKALMRKLAKAHLLPGFTFLRNLCGESYHTYFPQFAENVVHLVPTNGDLEIGLDSRMLTEQDIELLSHFYDTEYKNIPRTTCPALGIFIDDLYLDILSLYCACMKLT